MKAFKIGVKIMGLVGILLLLQAISSGFGIIKIGYIGEELKGIAEQDIPMTEVVTEITVHQLEQAVWFERALRFGQVSVNKNHAAKDLEHAKASFESHSKDVETIIEKAKKLGADAAENAHTSEEHQAFAQVDSLLEEIEKEYKKYAANSHHAFELIDKGQLHEAQELAEAIEVEEKALDHKLKKLLKIIETYTEAAAQKAERDEKTAFTGMVTITVAALIIGILAGFIISKGITNPVNAAVAGLKDIAQGEGDLTMRITVKSRDEVGELAKWFNVFIEKLQGIIKDIASGVDTISSSSTELSAISTQMSQGVRDVSDRTNALSTASEEMSINMSNVASAMEETTTNTNAVASVADEMSATIDEIAINTDRVRQTSDAAAQKSTQASAHISQMEEAANDIGKVVVTITEISKQVNLLALNATIEAARAGEAGKGFAVVANEIKELALQTASASQDISQKIKAIQGSTGATVAQINDITQVVSEMNDLISGIASAVEEQSVATKEIASNVSQTSIGIEEANANVNQSSAVTGEISQDIAGVSMTMTEMADSSAQVNQSALDLSELSENLKVMVGQFKV